MFYYVLVIVLNPARCCYTSINSMYNKEDDNKMKERIGEGGNGWGRGRNKREMSERKGEEGN